MTIPVQITFRHMESSPAVETRVRELTDHLGTFSDRIQSCRVVVDSPHRHHHQGKVFNVKVQLAIPGEDVVVDMERPDRDGHEDVYVVLRDAFDAARRQLQQRMSSLRGEPTLREKPRRLTGPVASGAVPITPPMNPAPLLFAPLASREFGERVAAALGAAARAARRARVRRR